MPIAFHLVPVRPVLGLHDCPGFPVGSLCWHDPSCGFTRTFWAAASLAGLRALNTAVISIHLCDSLKNHCLLARIQAPKRQTEYDFAQHCIPSTEHCDKMWTNSPDRKRPLGQSPSPLQEQGGQPATGEKTSTHPQPHLKHLGAVCGNQQGPMLPGNTIVMGGGRCGLIAIPRPLPPPTHNLSPIAGTHRKQEFQTVRS